VVSEEHRMNMGNKEYEKLVLLQMPQSTRCKLLRQVRERLRVKALEAKAWCELLQVDDLTINGITVWKENQQLSGFGARARKRM
jgi:hypothetical protein